MVCSYTTIDTVRSAITATAELVIHNYNISQSTGSGEFKVYLDLS